MSKIEEPKKEGFQSVEVQDSFVYKGKIEQIGIPQNVDRHTIQFPTPSGSVAMITEPILKEGDTVLFAKYSPDTQEIEHEGVKYKIVNMEDVLAVL